ncbi:MAG: YlmC/YmxH family sporulation protein [Ruminococcaceae bacterium]|nr:YlmC/YmxH family sporulation protein [Oscillospiraceae bacterium]
MTERVRELQKKEVINLSNGKRLGFVYDAEIDLQTGTLKSLIVPCRNSIFRFFFKYEELIIDFETIKKIGDDIILVELE